MNMESNFIVPDLTVKYILLQRTELQRYQTIAKKLRLPYHPYISSIETFLRGEKLSKVWLSKFQMNMRLLNHIFIVMFQEY